MANFLKKLERKIIRPILKPAGNLLGKVTGAESAERSADAMEGAALAGIEEQRRQYDLSREDLAPFREFGIDYGINKLIPLLQGDYSGFKADPGYHFMRDEGIKAIENSASGVGALGSGGMFKELQRYGTGLADQQYGDYWNRLAGIAGVGQSSTNQLSALGANYANRISEGQRDIGEARASGYTGKYNAYANFANNLLKFGAAKWGMGE